MHGTTWRTRAQGWLQTGIARLPAALWQRWTLLNAAGWGLAWLLVWVWLAFGGALQTWLGGFGALLIPVLFIGVSAVVGGVVGTCQAIALWRVLPPRSWLIWCVAGAALGMLPLAVLWWALLLGWSAGFALIGAAFGALWGLMQGQGLRTLAIKPAPPLVVWALANAGAGALCGAVSPLLPLIGGIVGGAGFGIITAWAWRASANASE
jgi:hypothetical protein